jgi:alkyl hydroperoxide reductase subunit AhpF
VRGLPLHRDGPLFKDIAVVGGGNSGVEAVDLANIVGSDPDRIWRSTAR